MSTMANTRNEDVAAVGPGKRWFQLSVFKDRAVTRSLVERAEAAGFGMLELTVDTPRVGKREADDRNHLAFPAGLEDPEPPWGLGAHSRAWAKGRSRARFDDSTDRINESWPL